MSGHSKWAKIKRAKGVTDAKRGALFTKLGRQITMTAQEGGGDITMNFALRLAVEKAKLGNMPSDTIERAIKKGTGEIESVAVKGVTYEAMTPSGVGILIDCTTDNTNRSLSAVRSAAEGLGCKMGAIGSVSWQFVQKGAIEVAAAKVKKSEKFGVADEYIPVKEASELEEALLELPDVLDYAESSSEEHEDRTVYTVMIEKSALKHATAALSDMGWQILDSQIIQHPNDTVEVAAENEEKLQNILEALEDLDDVDNVWTNAKGY